MAAWWKSWVNIIQISLTCCIRSGWTQIHFAFVACCFQFDLSNRFWSTESWKTTWKSIIFICWRFMRNYVIGANITIFLGPDYWPAFTLRGLFLFKYISRVWQRIGNFQFLLFGVFDSNRIFVHQRLTNLTCFTWHCKVGLSTANRGQKLWDINLNWHTFFENY